MLNHTCHIGQSCGATGSTFRDGWDPLAGTAAISDASEEYREPDERDGPTVVDVGSEEEAADVHDETHGERECRRKSVGTCRGQGVVERSLGAPCADRLPRRTSPCRTFNIRLRDFPKTI